MRPPEPVLVLDLFPVERAALLDLLSGLDADQWQAPTVCAGWSVKDVAAHIVGDDLGRLSRQRDSFLAIAPEPGESLVAFINRLNGEWVQAMRRLSPRLVCELLRSGGDATQALFASLDPYALGDPVSWAGPDPAPVWLDLAREYTERWHHQAHIRDALGVAPLSEPCLFAPVLATFVLALPYTFRDVEATDGTAVQVHIAGDSGGDWALVHMERGWKLYSGAPTSAAARVTLDQALAWQLFTKGVTPDEAASGVRIEGDARLGRHVLEAVAIIA
jgi:uncharacterized protein (TIGR03083 family)